MVVSRQMAEQAAVVLDVDMSAPGFSEEVVQLAYRSRAKRYHPDKPGGDVAKFVEADKAKCILIKWLARPKAPPPPDASIPIDKCLQCAGAGRRKVQRGFRSMTIMCGACRGTGERLPPEKLEE